ncbi:MAG: sugar ABC transporter permease [Lentisphaerales bacterium]|nr:sugar ABC transporter permease [Lentisphaerales bacterium]
MSLSPEKGQQSTALFANYERLLNDKLFYKAAFNTAKYALLSILTIIPLSLTLAFLLSLLSKRLRYISSFILLLPGLLPPIVLAILFMNVFHGREGLLNQVFILPFGERAVNWMSDPNYILPSMVIQSVWRWTGFVTLFLLCGLEAIPRSVKEAARLEGAGEFLIFRSIEIPGVKHLIIFCTAFLFIDTFSLFAGSFTLLGPSGGTANAGLIIVNYAYRFTRFQEYNMAATVCLATLPVLMLLTGLFCIKRKEK